MCYRRVLTLWASVLLSMVLVACGGGGGGTSSSGDVNPFVRAAAAAVGLDRFLLYPNPVQLDDGTFQVGAAEYAVAYYRAVDPNNDRDTLAKFKAFNSIGVTTGGHSEYNVIVGDQRDLGYGRKMTAHRKPDGTLAFVVENYLVGAYGGYSPLNLEAAIKGVDQWHLGTNAIEFSPGPLAGSGGRPADGSFVKFYTYDPKTGARLNTISLDGRPAKAMPTVCTSCHGGRGDPLTPPDAGGNKLFALVMNSYSQHRGDVQARLHPFEPASFDFSTIPGFSRAEQEAAIKEINKLVLCSFPLPTGTVATRPEDLCRRVAIQDEYQGAAATHLKAMYGGDPPPVNPAANGMPNPITFTVDNYVEASWDVAGQRPLYLTVQAEACRVCHLLRGTGNQADISFETFQHFDSYKDRIKAHIVDRGNMPLAKLIYDKFHSTVAMLQTMASYLKSITPGGSFADGDLRPERPIADPGPDRVVKPGTTTLSAAMSLFSTGYQWTLVGGPAGATLLNTTSATPTFTALADGLYQVQLVTTKGAATSAAAVLQIAVDSNLPYDPATLNFAAIKTTLQTTLGDCVSCHTAGGNGLVVPPIWYSSYDRAGTGLGTENSVLNDHFYYTELRGRVNLTDWIASPLLRKPSGNHHNGLERANFRVTGNPPGHADRADYDKFVSWIVRGAPQF